MLVLVSLFEVLILQEIWFLGGRVIWNNQQLFSFSVDYLLLEGDLSALQLDKLNFKSFNQRYFYVKFGWAGEDKNVKTLRQKR